MFILKNSIKNPEMHTSKITVNNSMIVFAFMFLISCASNVHQISTEEFRYLSSEKNLSYKIITPDKSEYEFQQYTLQNDTLIIYPKQYLYYKRDTVRIALEQIEFGTVTPVSSRAFSYKSIFIPMLFCLFVGSYIFMGEALKGL